MNRHSLRVAAALLMLSAGGCSSNGRPSSSNGSGPQDAPPGAAIASPQPQAASAADSDAIRAAIEDHLRNDHSINMAVMDVSVDSVSVDGDQAQANAAFHLKQGGTGMAMTYSLERHAGNWLVTKSQPSDGDFVHPPMDKTHSGAGPDSPAPAIPDVTDILKNHSPAN